MSDPLRREADAFRVVVAFVVGAAIVIAVTLASSGVYGVITAAALLGFGAGKLWSDFRHRRGGETAGGGSVEGTGAGGTAPNRSGGAGG